MNEPCTTIFFGGPRDGELVPPELNDGRGTIDIPVYSPVLVDFGDEPSIDDGFRIVTYKRHRVVVSGDPETITDLWCLNNRYPGQYFQALKDHIARTQYSLAYIKRFNAASEQPNQACTDAKARDQAMFQKAVEMRVSAFRKGMANGEPQ